MFDIVGNPRERRLRRTVASAVLAVVRSRVVRLFAALVVVVLIGAGLYVNGLYRAALAEECRELLDADPSMDELITLRGRVTAYQQDPSPGASLDLSGREVSFLFGERRDFQMQAQVYGSVAHVDLAVPNEGRCWNIRYVGSLAVRSGVVVLTPSEVVVGEADLSRWVGGRTWRFQAEQLPDDVLARTVRNTESLDLDDGLVRVRLANRWDVW